MSVFVDVPFGPQERKEKWQTRPQAQGVGRGDGSGQRGSLGAEVKGHQPGPVRVPGGAPQASPRQRAAQQPAAPNREGLHRHDRVLAETG